MASAPSRQDVEQLHRQMMQASVDAAQLDKQLQEERSADYIGGELRSWNDQADALRSAVERARAGLIAGGTPREQIDRIRDRLVDIKARTRNFDVGNDLDGCVGHWQSLGVEFSQLSGDGREELVQLLDNRKFRIDQTTAVLSQARKSEGMLPEQYRKVQQLTADRDRARDKYETLRQQYIEAERDYQLAEQQKAKQQAAAQEHKTVAAPLPNLSGLAKKGPVLVRLPVEPPKADAKSTAAPTAKPQVVKPVPLPKQLEKKPEPKKVEAKKPEPRPDAKKVEQPKKPEPKAADGKKPETGAKKPPEKKADAPKKLDEKKQPPKPQPAPPANRPAAVLAPKKSLTEAQQAALQRTAAAAKSGPPQISLERVEKVAGYPTAMDGIGRGAQTAQIYFRADHLGDLQIQGAASIQLGCAVRLDVLPSVQIFSATAGAPVRGKLSLGLISSGGQLLTVPPKNALDSAKQAASKSAAAVAARLGILGKQLQSAIEDVLEDAAEKIFGRAQAKAVPNKLPIRLAGPQPKGPSVEFQVARFNHALGTTIVEARQVKGGQTEKHKLGALLDRDHQHRDSVASRLEQTLSHLATATHRVLTDTTAGELRSNLARMDSILARLKGKAGPEVSDGAQEISQILQRMGSIASSKGGAPHIAEFRKLIEERKVQLKGIVGASARQEKAPKHQLPSAAQHASAVKQLHELRKHNPGLDKLLKNAAQSQLAAELAKMQKGGLQQAQGKRMHGPSNFKLLGLDGGLTALGGVVGGAHLGGFGGGHRGGLAGVSGMGIALSKALSKQLEGDLRRAKPADAGKILAGFQKAPKGSPLNDLAKQADAKQKRLATQRSHRGPMPSHITAQALYEVFQEHPKGKSFAQYLAPGGPLRILCEAAQRGHGLPIGKTAQHYLAARGSAPLWNAVSTFNSLVKEGHQPHFWSLSSIAGAIKDTASGALSKVTSVASKVTSFAGSAMDTVKSGVSSFGNEALSFGSKAFSTVKSVAGRAVGGAKNFVSQKVGQVTNLGKTLYDKASNALHSAGSYVSKKAHGLYQAGSSVAQKAWGGIQRAGAGLQHVAKSGAHLLQSGVSWAQQKAGAAVDWAKHAAGGAVDWAKHKAAIVGNKIHSGIEFVKKTGVVGALGKGLKSGLSMVKTAASYSPLGLAYQAAMKGGQWLKGGGLQKAWAATKNVAGKAWSGLKTAYKATSNFLQSPAGQLLVTGLSLAASFIPGGLVVKAIIGGGIGAIQAISEGKNWQGILAGAAGGALTGAVPFLKLGPFAKMGVGALSGGISALASGGNIQDALKGAAGGALDSVDPGAFGALKRMKGFATAEKLLGGKNLSKAEKAFLSESKFAGPLRGLEKAMTNPKFRKSIGGIEKVAGKAIKGGIWVSGKAAKAQGMLETVLGAGDKVQGVLSQVHDLAPGLSQMLGDNAAGNFVAKVGDLAGKGDEKLSQALQYGHSADDAMTKYRGYLDKGLGYAGVKNPKKAYEKMQARKDLKSGKKGSLEHVAKLKAEDHQKKHPELHLAEATGKRTRGSHAEAPGKRKRAGATADKQPGAESDKRTAAKKGARKTSPHDAKGADSEGAKKPARKAVGNKPQTKLEQALAKGKGLIKQGQKVAQGVHGGLGKVHAVVAKGLKGAEEVQSGLEKASALAQQGADILGGDTELGKYLLEVSSKADQVHGFLAQGIALADEFNKKVGAVHDGMEQIPGVHGDHEHKKKTPLDEAAHLGGKGKGKGKDKSQGAEGKTSPHDKAPTHGPVLKAHAAETDAQKSERYKRAWDKISFVSSEVQKFETEQAKTQKKIQELLQKGQGNAASIELMGLGSECDSIHKAIAEAKTLAKGHPQYEKEIKFYEEWHQKTAAKLHTAIANTKGLGGQVAISHAGISEATHPDIYENTKNIYSVRTKVESFGDALHDAAAKEHVKKVLDEAKQAKSDLGRLKGKYKNDKAATSFLTGGGVQDKLIDEAMTKLQAALKGEAPAGKKGDLTKHDASHKTGEKRKPQDTIKHVEHGLKAIEKYKKKALKAGKKLDSGLVKVEGMLGKGIKTGKKIDSSLEKIAHLADHVGKALGEDTPIGHLAEQVSNSAQAGHDKLHHALNTASKGKSSLHKGEALFHQGLAAAQEHHAQKLEKVHGKKPAGAEHQHGGVPQAELLKHAVAPHPHKPSPHGDAGDAALLGKDAKKLVHDALKTEKDATHAYKDVQHFYKGGKKMVHGVEHAFGDAKGVWGDVKSGNWKAALKDGKGLVGDAKGLFQQGQGLFGEGKKLFGEGKGLVGDGKGLVGDVKSLWGGVKGLFGGHAKAPSGGGESHGGLLSVGSQGPAVADVQNKLAAAGFKPGPADGIFGPNTRNAVIAFQRARKLKVDGIVGPETLGALNAGGGKPAPHDGPKKPGPQPAGGGEAEAAALVTSALQLVTVFGKDVTGAVKEIQALMSAGKTKEAGDRVQAVSMTSEHARSEVARAVSASSKFGKLAKQAQAASKHYLEIRGHFFTFVKGLHGLAGKAQEAQAASATQDPELLKLMADIKSLQVKVGALGHAKSSDSAMQPHVEELKKEAQALRARVSKAESKHAKDEKAQALIKDIDAKLAQLEKQLGAHADKAAAKKGDKDLGVKGKKPTKPAAPAQQKPQDPVDQLIGDILGGDHRIHVDKGGARELDVHDGQDVDPAAMDTWIGSGEGVKLFSEVFGAFVPAEGALEQTQVGGGGGKPSGGGTQPASGGAPAVHPQTGLPIAKPGMPGGPGGGIHFPGQLPGVPGAGGLPGLPGLPKLPGIGGGVGAIVGKIGGMLPGRVTGFFKGLFDHLHGFADKISGFAKFGAGMLGKGMHYAEMGMHGLNQVQGAAGKVQGFAGKAEGFLDKMGLTKLGGFAGKIGGAAGWVGQEAQVLQGGLKQADKWMGQGKAMAGQVEGVAGKAGGIFDQAAHGRFGSLVNLFKASKSGDGMDGKLVPEKMSLSSALDEPRRLDISTMSRMEMFLGGTFSGVRIHTGPGAAQVTSRFAAEAVTVKDHIFFAPGRFNPSTTEGQRLLAHELTHVLQKGRPNLDVRTAETEALHSEHSFGTSPDMTTLNLSQPQPDFKLADGMGLGNASGVHTAKRNRSKGHETGAKDELPDGEEFLEQVSGRVYELLMDELEHSFESR